MQLIFGWKNVLHFQSLELDTVGLRRFFQKDNMRNPDCCRGLHRLSKDYWKAMFHFFFSIYNSVNHCKPHLLLKWFDLLNNGTEPHPVLCFSNSHSPVDCLFTWGKLLTIGPSVNSFKGTSTLSKHLFVIKLLQSGACFQQWIKTQIYF